jgi:ribosomal protein S18 acetylase RimI-like enzyme/ADP-ribose pyrophosphatase YjhB (NUDIX family)
VNIRRVRNADADAIWAIFHAIVAGRDTYAFAPDTPREVGVGYWFGPDVTGFVAEFDGRVAGMSKLVPNRPDLGGHVANASFMVAPSAAGRGVGRALGTHCLREARAQGYDAMQFNFVVSTNTRAVELWKQLGFSIVGTLPRAFQHGSLGLVDAYVMHRFLDDIVLTFGTGPGEAATAVRPSAYAVVPNAAGAIAIVEGEEAVMLPGGGVDANESSAAAVIREVAEECALAIRVTTGLGEAVQFVHSAKKATHFEKRSSFVAAEIVAEIPRTPDHVTRWLSCAAAIDTVSYESHAWALKRWARLNT